MNSKIIVDSCVDFNKALSDTKVPLARVPFKLNIGGQEIIDDGSFSMHEIITKMKESKEKITTSCPSPNDFMNEIEEDKHNYIITISSKLSGSYNSAMVAKSSVKLSGNGSVDVIDSRSATAAESLITLKLYNLIMKGFDRTRVLEEINNFISGMKTRFILNSLDNLAKNGRITNMSALFGKLLHIVPIMCENGNGEIALKEKVRGRSSAINRLRNIIEEEASEAKREILAITHVNAKELAKKIRNEIVRKGIFKEILIFDASGLSTVYADDGGIVVAY